MNVHSNIIEQRDGGKTMPRTKDASLSDRILDAAFAVFGSRGYQATTVKEIADAAGVASGSVYTCFKDKEDLFRTSVQRGWERLLSEMEELAASEEKQSSKIDDLLEKGFVTLECALPLLRGMFSDSNRMNLLPGYLDRLCEAIQRIFGIRGPGQEPPPSDGKGSVNLLTKAVVSGILFTMAMTDPDRTSAEIRVLKNEVRQVITNLEAFAAMHPPERDGRP
jgi:TetR/AcrR family transcriptional regulator, fatty acid metabolism regulator protein